MFALLYFIGQIYLFSETPIIERVAHGGVKVNLLDEQIKVVPLLLDACGSLEG